MARLSGTAVRDALTKSGKALLEALFVTSGLWWRPASLWLDRLTVRIEALEGGHAE
jgi:hypothetical protein